MEKHYIYLTWVTGGEYVVQCPVEVRGQLVGGSSFSNI